MPTITEALAEIKTIRKRIEKKAENIQPYIWRQDTLRDPLEKQGGSAKFIQEERQAIRDLQERIVTIRAAIAASNGRTEVTINGVSRTIEQWLVWRRDVAPVLQANLQRIRIVLNQAHSHTVKGNLLDRIRNREPQQVEQAVEVIVNLDEQAFAKEVEAVEDTLGQLDGQLSLKNSTINLHL